MLSRIVSLAKNVVPRGVRRRAARLLARPQVGSVKFGDLRRTRPISRNWGSERGTPIDRVLIEEFLLGHADGVGGRVLEWGDRSYTTRLGGGRVSGSDVFDVDGENAAATIVGDLCTPDGLPSEAFDCILCLQTLQFVPDLPAAIRALDRMLCPGGLLLVTVPGIAPVRITRVNPWPDYWRLTPTSMRWLVDDAFGGGAVEVTPLGNVLTASAFLQGIAAEELSAQELAEHDPGYPVIVGVAVRKAGARR
jgi:SAM-dependent methyltransferase